LSTFRNFVLKEIASLFVNLARKHCFVERPDIFSSHLRKVCYIASRQTISTVWVSVQSDDLHFLLSGSPAGPSVAFFFHVSLRTRAVSVFCL
jgi:hypothetical protein